MLGWKGEDLSPNSDRSIEKFIIKASEKSNKRTPNDGSFVKVHIIGRYESEIFENRDVEFNIGEGSEENVIEGVEIAIQKMRIGEIARITIKSKYAFGSEGHAKFKIPADATVEYEITLNEFEREQDTWKLNEEESMAQAVLFKSKGTKYLKENKLKLAIKMYEKSNTYLSNCSEYISSITHIFGFNLLSVTDLNID